MIRTHVLLGLGLSQTAASTHAYDTVIPTQEPCLVLCMECVALSTEYCDSLRFLTTASVAA